MDFKILIPFITFFILFFIAYKKKNKVSMTIVGLYLLSSFCSFFMDESVLVSHDFAKDTLGNVVLYTVLLSAFLLLTLRIKPFVSISRLPKGPYFEFIVTILSIGALFSIIYLAPYAIRSLSVDASVIRKQIMEEGVLPPSIFTTLAVGFPSFYYLYAFIFYVYLVQKKGTWKRIFMLIGVLSIVVNVLTVAGRDGVLLALLAMLIGFFLFEPLIEKKTRRLLIRSFTIISTLFFAIIVSITIERFISYGGDDYFKIFKIGFIGYLGMQPYIFNEYINVHENFNFGTTHFPLITNVLGIDPPSYYGERKPYTWMFGTFLTAFYSVSGFSSLIILTAFFWLYFNKYVNKIKKYKVNYITIFLFYGLLFHFLVSGLFYFRLGNKGGNLFILISIISISLIQFYKRTNNKNIN